MRRTFRVFVLLVVLVPSSLAAAEPPRFQMIPAEGEAAKYWPRWRGPTGQGVAADGDYPDRWSSTENVLWKVEIPGSGLSSPIVFRDSLFLTAALGNGAERLLLCFDRATGKLRWQAKSPGSVPEKPGFKNGHATSTPCTDGERIYVYFGSQGLVCYDFDGKRVWHQDFGLIQTRHGPGGSVLLYRDRVIIYQERNNGSFVAAFDTKTGKQIWRTPRKETVGWGTPVAVRAGNRDEIIVSSEYCVYGYDPETGKQLWRCEGSTDEVTPTPVVGHGFLICSSGRQGPTLAIRAGGNGDVTDTHVAWRALKGSPFIPSPVLLGEYLYLVNDMLSVATCYDARNGRLQWQERVGKAAKEGFSASPVAVNGKVFFTNDEGETYVIKAGAAFELLRVNRLGEKVLSSPALVEGKWYIRGQKHLYCVGKQ